MSGPWVIELAQKTWTAMDEAERSVFDDWLSAASGRDLYLLVRYAMGYKKRSSSQRIRAVTGNEKPDV
jgi:hypothetical protein